MSVTFDEDHLVPNAGLLLPAVLTQRLGIAGLIARRVRLDRDRAGSANSAAKAVTVLGGMLAGADCIDDLDVLRAGAGPQLFDDLRAPSTIGTWLRAFNGPMSASSTPSPARFWHGHGRQGLVRQIWPAR